MSFDKNDLSSKQILLFFFIVVICLTFIVFVEIFKLGNSGKIARILSYICFAGVFVSVAIIKKRNSNR